jgi:FeS assembly SUF system regulator
MIRMTKTADYGIVLLTRMASRPDHLYTAVELSNQTGVPHPMVSKVLKLLARRGMLESHRGAKGGYALSRDPHEIPVIDVITALDGPIGITECIDDAPGECGQESICQVKGNWQRINDAIRRALAEVTLAEMTPAKDLVHLGDGGVRERSSGDRGAAAPAGLN